MNYEKCDCGQKATWLYMPGFREGSPFFCDDCVHRGCSCNHRYVKEDSYHPPLDSPDMPEGIEGVDWKWIEPDKVWCHIDEKMEKTRQEVYKQLGREDLLDK